MLDIKFIRENPLLVKEAARKKHIVFDVEKLLDIDTRRRECLREVEILRAELNAASDAIGAIQDGEEKKRAIKNTKELKSTLQEKEKELTDIVVQFEQMMYGVPNIPDPSVPEGETDAENREIRVGGVKPEFSFEPRDHMMILENLDLADFERGAKVAGFRGYFLKNEAVFLSLGLWQYALSFLSQKGFVPLFAPALARESNFVGTGYFPLGVDDVYKTQDDLYFVGTSEVSVMGMFQNEIFEEDSLPLKFVAFSPCFRREAGAYGKDTKGLYRVHEFMKVEQVVFCRADHQDSVRLHEELNQNAEEIMQALGLYYRVVANCGGDLGLGQVKKYDIEAWLPSRQIFGETHSASYFHDFQTRRLNIRYRDKEGTLRFIHSLNATAVATPRLLMSLLEQFQREDGSVLVPKVLESYVGKSLLQKNNAAFGKN